MQWSKFSIRTIKLIQNDCGIIPLVANNKFHQIVSTSLSNQYGQLYLADSKYTFLYNNQGVSLNDITPSFIINLMSVLVSKPNDQLLSEVTVITVYNIINKQLQVDLVMYIFCDFTQRGQSFRMPSITILIHPSSSYLNVLFSFLYHILTHNIFRHCHSGASPPSPLKTWKSKNIFLGGLWRFLSRTIAGPKSDFQCKKGWEAVRTTPMHDLCCSIMCNKID